MKKAKTKKVDKEVENEAVNAAEETVKEEEVKPAKAVSKPILHRIARAAGHFSGIKRMIEADRFYGDILIQLAAVRAEIDALGNAIVKEHIDESVAKLATEDNEQTVNELMAAIEKLLK